MAPGAGLHVAIFRKMTGNSQPGLEPIAGSGPAGRRPRDRAPAAAWPVRGERKYSTDGAAKACLPTCRSYRPEAQHGRRLREHACRLTGRIDRKCSTGGAARECLPTYRSYGPEVQHGRRCESMHADLPVISDRKHRTYVSPDASQVGDHLTQAPRARRVISREHDPVPAGAAPGAGPGVAEVRAIREARAATHEVHQLLEKLFKAAHEETRRLHRAASAPSLEPSSWQRRLVGLTRTSAHCDNPGVRPSPAAPRPSRCASFARRTATIPLCVPSPGARRPSHRAPTPTAHPPPPRTHPRRAPTPSAPPRPLRASTSPAARPLPRQAPP
jgi:hypothetical protein